MSVTGSVSAREVYAAELGQICARFEHLGSGQAVIRDRSFLLDSLISELWEETTARFGSGTDASLVAIGGYGRQELFPCSDVDVLFVSGSALSSSWEKTVIPAVCQKLWDLHLRVSPTTRTLNECGRLHRDNVEFNISLLDCRFICGDKATFDRLRNKLIPELVASEARELRKKLLALTHARHAKYGHTIFHLEPNIKDGPGGMRDYQLLRWLATILQLEKTGCWPRTFPIPSADAEAAFRFLCDVRCFLHFRQARDWNNLSYELQSAAATAGIGVGSVQTNAAEWMRTYFRHLRSIDVLLGSFEEPPFPESFLSKVAKAAAAYSSDPHVEIIRPGRIRLRRNSVQDPQAWLTLFESVARDGVRLTAETERQLQASLPQASRLSQLSLWQNFRRILLLPNAGNSLRTMHRLGLLVTLFPELQAIDSLVVRDYYHRYTVDEHSLLAIENLHALRTATDNWSKKFREILEGVEQPELLFLALLFHDVGKGMSCESHVEGSAEALGHVLERLDLPEPDGETVLFLVRNHLKLSATIGRRDIFDPAVVHDFSQLVATEQKLKMLTLLTYADTKSVNPESLTPWKAELIWQLYVSTANDLNRSADDERVGTQLAHNARIERAVAAIAKGSTGHLAAFLEGFPKRYISMHSAAEIAEHCRLYDRLRTDEPQIAIAKQDGFFEMVMLALDSPFLFASVVGVLASWGMNILKVEAFANKAGVVLDTFRFCDRFQTLEMNPVEEEQLKRDLEEVITGQIEVAELMHTKFRPATRTPKVEIGQQIYIDDHSSAHSTLIEVTAQDRPGLLYDLSSTLSQMGCNIEIAIVDTQGLAANDVFYVTCVGRKLDSEHKRSIRTALQQRI